MNAPERLARGSEPEVTVRIGEAKFAASGSLKATLGSCVGIGLLWRARQRCVLAHCLLPSAPEHGSVSASRADAAAGADARARYVQDALPALFHLLEVDRRSYRDLEAVLVGGARLAKLGLGAAGQIGQHNIDAARRALATAGLRTVLEQVGGERGWQVWLDVSLMRYSAREIAVLPDRMTAPPEVSNGHARTR